MINISEEKIYKSLKQCEEIDYYYMLNKDYNKFMVATDNKQDIENLTNMLGLLPHILKLSSEKQNKIIEAIYSVASILVQQQINELKELVMYVALNKISVTALNDMLEAEEKYANKGMDVGAREISMKVNVESSIDKKEIRSIEEQSHSLNESEEHIRGSLGGLLAILGSLEVEKNSKYKNVYDYTKKINTKSNLDLDRKFAGELTAKLGEIKGDPLIKAQAVKIRNEAKNRSKE